MDNLRLDKDTIAAIATPPGRGGIGIIRISGPSAQQIAEKITGCSLVHRHAHFVNFNDENGVVDEGLCLYFKSPQSFTGEDCAELHCHGSPIVLNILLRQIMDHGARLARPGEFSERAFLNNKIDLAQAEAVADLIEASSIHAARGALRSLQGAFSREINEFLNALIETRMFIESSLDFPEEEIDFVDNNKLMDQVLGLIKKLDSILKKTKQGTVLREGLKIVLAGAPNAGKSSLLNILGEKDIAIVSDIAGTTRDVIRETIVINGIPMHFCDTAGLRHSENSIEQEGIRRTWTEMDSADVIINVVDSTVLDNGHPMVAFEKHSNEKPVILIHNKCDISGRKAGFDNGFLSISAKTGAGVDVLKRKLIEIAGFSETAGEAGFVARSRHVDILVRCLNILVDGKSRFSKHPALELLAEDLRQIQILLGSITGQFTTEDLLGKIFSEFCIGK